jgi:hypothetical protein
VFLDAKGDGKLVRYDDLKTIKAAYRKAQYKHRPADEKLQPWLPGTKHAANTPDSERHKIIDGVLRAYFRDMQKQDRKTNRPNPRGRVSYSQWSLKR